jgi:recombinational DNA repair ATPase RecF
MKIKITKFKRVEDKEFEIPATITGGNGKNKTSILEAISFVFTGKDLNGNEFKQVYDNRIEDLHEAIADVSYFDNYGNEWRRIVKPTFQTGRDGVETIKTKRSTECKKNGISVNDFSGEFSDFYNLGTDYFFRQKESDQRTIFLESLKSKMPNYYIKDAQLKKKELEKSQKAKVEEIKSAQNTIKALLSVEIPKVDEDLLEKHNEYLSLSQSVDQTLINEINERNIKAINDYSAAKSELSELIQTKKNEKSSLENSLSQTVEQIKVIESKQFDPIKEQSTEQLEKEIEALKSDFAKCEYFDDLAAFASVYFESNPILVENRKEIETILAKQFDATIGGKCPINGQFCEVSEAKAQTAFDKQKEAEIEAIKANNRSILTKMMNGANETYISLKGKLTRFESELSEIKERNSKVEEQNKTEKAKFEKSKADDLKALNLRVDELKKEIEITETSIAGFEKELSELKEPTPEKLPEANTISEDLKEAHTAYLEFEKEIIGANAINANNAKQKALKEAEIKANRDLLFTIGEELATLKNEISDYFSNLKGVVKTEFAGEIEIDVELQEFIMSRNEYDDCFRITANGCIFPYECNGALINNTKFQILAGLQRLAKYNGLTIMDNCEANTSQPINICGTNAVISIANFDEELSINN